MLRTAVLSRISGCKGNWDLFTFSASGSAATFVRPRAKGIRRLHKSCEGYLEPPVPAGSAGLSQCWLPRAVTQCCPLGCTSSPLPTEPGKNLMTEVSSVGICWLEGSGNVGLLSVMMCVLGEVTELLDVISSVCGSARELRGQKLLSFVLDSTVLWFYIFVG